LGQKLAPLGWLLKLLIVVTLVDTDAVKAGGKEGFKIHELGF
jgi:hypothetical protein